MAVGEHPFMGKVIVGRVVEIGKNAARYDAEMKICGSGSGVCEVRFLSGTDVREVARYLAAKVFG